MNELWPNTALEPTAITPVSFRFGFRVGGSHRRRGWYVLQSYSAGGEEGQAKPTAAGGE